MYKVLLILKYLRRRYIAWVSLVAVALCTALVIIVISVMGGWLRMFRQSFHGLQGDILVQGQSLSGFPYYEEMVRRIEELPGVGPGCAAPVIHTYGLLSIAGIQTSGVQVLGYPIDKIGNVNNFDTSLYRQSIACRQAAEQLKDPKLPAPQRAIDQALVAAPATRPSFKLLPRQATAPLSRLPAEIAKLPQLSGAEVGYDPVAKQLAWKSADWIHEPIEELLLSRSSDAEYQKAVKQLVYASKWEAVDYAGLTKVGDKALRWAGMIVSTGIMGIEKDDDGQLAGRTPNEYRFAVTLTVPLIEANSAMADVGNAPHRPYWIVDDSHTGVYQNDQQTVYVPFDVIQHDLAMDIQKDDSGAEVTPARSSMIYVKVKAGYDLYAVKRQIAQIVRDVRAHQGVMIGYPVDVITWEESQKDFLGAVENEKSLVTFLMSLISVVAIMLILCIFYMIVVEKTRDIGVIKSVGATNAGVAGIFLGYGMAIGIVGSGLGLIGGYLVVHNINELHKAMGRWLGIQIWRPKVYMFDIIPNTMNPKEVAVIIAVAIVSAVIGSLLPAVLAAWKNPVEALRWE